MSRVIAGDFKLPLSTISLLFVAIMLQGCMTNSEGGMTLGRKGSIAWHATAPLSDKNRYFDTKSIVGLCNFWAENYPGGHPAWEENREQVGLALLRRGQDPMYCANPTDDSVSIAKDEAKAAKREAKKAKEEARKAKREACEAKVEAYNECREAQNINSGMYKVCIIPPMGC